MMFLENFLQAIGSSAMVVYLVFSINSYFYAAKPSNIYVGRYIATMNGWLLAASFPRPFDSFDISLPPTGSRSVGLGQVPRSVYSRAVKQLIIYTRYIAQRVISNL